MPIRGLMYFAKLYEAYLKTHHHDVYGTKLISLPAPQYFVFYNGDKEIEDKVVLRLSDAFAPQPDADDAVLECKATVLNINYGHNESLMQACKRLHDYAYFIAEVKHNLAQKLSIPYAIELAIDTCIEKGILADLLEKCRSEVYAMLLTEYDEKKYNKILREAERAEGRAEGILVGEERMKALNKYLITSGRIDDILKASEDKDYCEQLLKEFELY